MVFLFPHKNIRCVAIGGVTTNILMQTEEKLFRAQLTKA